MKRVYWRCGCGLINYSWSDIWCHFKARGIRRGLILLLKTRPTLHPW